MAVVQAAVLAAVVLIVVPGYFFYFDVTPKIVVLFVGTAVVLLASAAGLFPLRSRLPRRALFTALVMLYGVSLLVSTLLSERPALSLFGTAWRGFGSLSQAAILLFSWMIALTCAGSPDRIRTVLRAVTLSAIVSAAYGIVQYAGWDPLLPAGAYHIGEGVWAIVRPPGTMGYASYFATWLVCATFLSLAQYLMEESALWRRLAVGGTVLSAASAIATGTRAAILALVVGTAALALAQGVRISPRRAVAVCLVVIAAGAFYYSPSGRQLRSRARWSVEDPWGGARRDLWRDSLAMASRRLAAGYGPETFTAGFPQFESVALARAYPDFSHESPHNILVDALVSQGVAGFLILAALCVDGFRRAWRLKTGALLAALTAGIVSQQFTVFTVPTAVVFFTILALIAALDGLPGLAPRGVVPFSVLPVIAACLLLYVSVRLTLADHALASTQRALDHEDLQLAAARYAEYRQYRLPGESADLWYSRRTLNLAIGSRNTLMRTAALLQSEAAAVEATRTSDDPFDSWYNLAVISGLHDNGARAAQCLQAAIAARPRWYKPHWMLAQVLVAQGRPEEARREAALATELDGGKHAEVSKTGHDLQVGLGDTPLESLQK